MIIICNLCFRQKSQTTELFLTNCRHVFCGNCLFQINQKCFVCNKMFKTIKIDSNMPQLMQRLFSPLDVELRKIQTIRQFQMEQINYYMGRKAHIPQYICKADRKRQELRERIDMIKRAMRQEQALFKRLTEFETSLTPNLSRLRASNSHTIFDDSPEISKEWNKTMSKTDSGYHWK